MGKETQLRHQWTHQAVLTEETQLKRISDQQVQSVMDKLNNRPRKYLGMKTPNQVFFKDYSFVALRSLNPRSIKSSDISSTKPCSMKKTIFAEQ